MSVTFRMSKDLEDRVQIICDMTGKTRSELIREAIECYLDQLGSLDKMSWLEILDASGFQPLDSGIKNLSRRKDMLRKKISERARRRSD